MAKTAAESYTISQSNATLEQSLTEDFSCCWRNLVGLWMDKTSLPQTYTEQNKTNQLIK